MLQIIMILVSMGIIVFLNFDPHLFFNYFSPVLFLCSNIATNNAFRDDPYNDQLSLPFQIIIVLVILFNKNFLMNLIFYGQLQWTREPEFLNKVALAVVYGVLFSKYVISNKTWRKIVRKPIMQYVVYVGDRIAQAGSPIFMLQRIHLDKMSFDHEILLYIYLTEIGTLINFIILRDFGAPFFKSFKNLIFSMLLNAVAYVPPYLVYSNQKGDELFLIKTVTTGFALYEIIYQLIHIPKMKEELTPTIVKNKKKTE